MLASKKVAAASHTLGQKRSWGSDQHGPSPGLSPRAHSQALRSRGHTYRGSSCTSSTIISTSTLQEEEGALVTSTEHWLVLVAPGGLLPEPRDPPEGQEYLQQGQGLQGDLSRQADHGGPGNKTKKNQVRRRAHPFPSSSHCAPYTLLPLFLLELDTLTI